MFCGHRSGDAEPRSGGGRGGGHRADVGHPARRPVRVPGGYAGARADRGRTRSGTARGLMRGRRSRRRRRRARRRSRQPGHLRLLRQQAADHRRGRRDRAALARGRGASSRSERNQGRALDMGWVAHERLGFNYRLTDLQAAIGIAQLERADGCWRTRARVAVAVQRAPRRDRRCARRGEGDPEGLVLPCADRGARATELVRLRGPAAPPRPTATRWSPSSAERGIEAKAYMPCIHLLPDYRRRFGCGRGKFPVAEDGPRRACWRSRSSARWASSRWSGSAPRWPERSACPPPEGRFGNPEGPVRSCRSRSSSARCAGCPPPIR